MAMVSLNFLLALMVLMAIYMPLSATQNTQDLHFKTELLESEEDANELLSEDGQSYSSPKPEGRFLAGRARRRCDIYPRICRGKGSTGPDCCYKQCVNVEEDRLNCGRCWNRCRYSELCCGGKCVNPSSNETHCGRCYNKCRKGSSCVYGMCSYA